jgi:hypothetical protein
MKKRPAERKAAPQSPAPQNPPWRTQTLRRLLPFAGLVVLILIAYSESPRGLLMFDNESIIVKDTRVHAATLDNVRSILTQPYWQAILSGLYRPLATLSYLFNYAVLGNETSPAMYHWINLLLHLMNTGLVYWLGLLLFEETAAAWLLGALWGVHPVLTEAVTNVVGRADLLAAFGVLAGLYCHRAASQRRGWRMAAWLVALALAAAIGIFSKENAIVLVAILALHDLIWPKAGAWRTRVAGYAAAVVPALIYLYVRGRVLAHALSAPIPFVDNPLTGADFWTARLTAVKVLVKQMGLWLWPARLSCDYSFNEIPLSGWGDPSAIFAVLVCVALAGLAIVSWRRNRAVSFAIAFFFIAVSPTSNIVILIGSIMAERFLYLPTIGLAILAVCALLAIRRQLSDRPQLRPFIAGVAAILVLALAARTYARNVDWTEERRFYRSAVEAAPGSFRTHVISFFTSLPLTPENRDRLVADADRALAILDGLPDSENAPEAYHDAGMVYRLVGERTPAPGTTPEYWYRKSLTALLRCERLQTERAEVYKRWNESRGLPGTSFMSTSLYLELGRTYMRLSDERRAVAAFERGRDLASDPDVLEELGGAYEAAGETRKAAMAFVEALAVDGKRTQLNGKLVELYGKIDPQGCSISRGGQPSLNVDCPLVHGDICTASRNVAAGYDRSGMSREGAYIRQVAVRDLGCSADALH